MRSEIFKRVLRSSGYNLNQIFLDISRKTGITSHTTQYQTIEAFSTAATTEKWDLYSAVCLERHPIIASPMQEIETKFSNLLKKIEFENSLKSDHELRIEREEKQNQLKSGIEDLDKSEIVMQTAQDMEDSYQEELNTFKFAPTVTKFDKKNITSTVQRKLDKCLLLLVQQKIGNAYFWIPPQGIRQEGETMRQTAERVLQNACGDKIKIKFYGNAPIGFYKYKYPKKLCVQGSCGAKVFYFLAKYEYGNITNNVKYQWLDREEVEKVLPNGVKKSISQFIFFL